MFSWQPGPGESDSVTNISLPPCPGRHVTPFDEFYAEPVLVSFELFQLQGQQNSANPRGSAWDFS